MQEDAVDYGYWWTEAMSRIGAAMRFDVHETLGQNPDSNPDEDSDNSVSKRPDGKRLMRGIKESVKARTAEMQGPFRGLSIYEKKERKSWIKTLARLGFSPDQMIGVLPALGIKMGRSQIYSYLMEVKLPRNYKRKIENMDHHDSMVLWAVARLAKDCARHEWRWSKLARNESPCVGAGMRPDFAWEVGPYRFFLEVQLSDLSDTLWRKKLYKYVRLRKRLGKGGRFRALIIVDGKRDMTIIRRAARDLMKQWGNAHASMFLFLPLTDLKGPDDLARGKYWIDEHGVNHAMLEWIR